MTLFQAVLLAFVEGLTEYLPISSTGHIILTSALFGIEADEFVKNFTVIVQFGAILSVVVVYWRRFFQSLDFYKKIAVAFLPAAIIGLAVKNKIDAVLGSVEIVAWALVIGGIILVLIDRKIPPHSHSDKTEADQSLSAISYKRAAIIGLSQCCAFIPGVSRSGSSIVGALMLGIDRKTAAEFSFFLGAPTLAGATLLKVIKIAPTITADQIQFIVVGNIVSFIIGYAAVKGFIRYLTKYGFAHFGWYRIIVGAALLALIYSGHSLHMM